MFTIKKKCLFLILILSISIFFTFDFKQYNINYKAFLLLSLIMFIAGPIGEHILIQKTGEWKYKNECPPLRVSLFLFPGWIMICFIVIVIYNILVKHFV